MRFLPFFFFCALGLTTSAWGLSYSCRDSNGTTYFADSLMRLPETCQGEAWQFEQQYYPEGATSVPETAPPQKNVGNLMERMIAEDDLALKIKQLEAQTRLAAENYAQGTEALNAPRRRWGYGTKARLEKWQKLVLDAQQTKKKILDALDSLQLSPQKRTEIEKQLEPIR